MHFGKLRLTKSFEGNANEKKSVSVFQNGYFEECKKMFLEPDWGLQDMLTNASQRLGIATTKRCFNADGVEIDDVMMVVDDDMLFISSGEDFISRPSTTKSFVSPLRKMNSDKDKDKYIKDGNDNNNKDINYKNTTTNISTNSNSSNDDDGIYDIYAQKGDNLPPIIGNYKVSTFLGRGGFGVVRVGKHHLTDEKVALKFINKSDILSIAAAERTMTEIQCLTALKHNNIICLTEHIETSQHVCLMFELMIGGDLTAYIHRRFIQLQNGNTTNSAGNGNGNVGIYGEDYDYTTGQKQMAALSEEETKKVFFQVISAVSYAHNNHICHRDLKLDNILLKNKDSLEIVKVADFGLSDFYRPGEARKSNCGTLAFLAPEGFTNKSNAGPPLDVWSLGVILFALLFGRLPFDGTSDDRDRDRGGYIDRDNGVFATGGDGNNNGSGKEKDKNGIGNEKQSTFGRYDLEERDRDNVRREEGRLLYNNKVIPDRTNANDRKKSTAIGGTGAGGQNIVNDDDMTTVTGEHQRGRSNSSKLKQLRPEQIIRGKIMKCQYNFDSHSSLHNQWNESNNNNNSNINVSGVSLEAKDLIRRMLVLDPEERASIPEIFSHVWNRSGADNHHNHHVPRDNRSNSNSKVNSNTNSNVNGSIDHRSRTGSGSSASSGDADSDNENTTKNNTGSGSSSSLPPVSPLYSPQLNSNTNRKRGHSDSESGGSLGLGLPAGLTRQESLLEKEIANKDRIDIIGSGKLAFGALAIKNEEEQEQTLKEQINTITRNSSYNSEGSADSSKRSNGNSNSNSNSNNNGVSSSQGQLTPSSMSSAEGTRRNSRNIINYNTDDFHSSAASGLALATALAPAPASRGYSLSPEPTMTDALDLEVSVSTLQPLDSLVPPLTMSVLDDMESTVTGTRSSSSLPSSARRDRSSSVGMNSIVAAGAMSMSTSTSAVNSPLPFPDNSSSTEKNISHGTMMVPLRRQMTRNDSFGSDDDSNSSSYQNSNSNSSNIQTQQKTAPRFDSSTKRSLSLSSVSFNHNNNNNNNNNHKDKNDHDSLSYELSRQNSGKINK
jgi:serine/threonine protein kinase